MSSKESPSAEPEEKRAGPEPPPRGTGLAALVAAALLGVLGDALLREGPPGLNLSLWVGAVLAAVFVLARRQGIALTGEGRWLFIPASLLAFAFLWRDSVVLVLLDMLALAVTAALAASYARGGTVRLDGVTDYGLRVAFAGAQSAFGMLPLLARDVQWSEARRGRWSEQVAAAVKGLVIATPLLLVFGALFMTADPMFQHVVTDLVGVDLSSVVSHLVLTAVLAALAGGFLRTVLWAGAPQHPGWQRSQPLSLGPVEVGITLGLLNLLFLAFVAVQFRYFFGGAALVEASTGLTYAEYARRGFFELVWVSALVLPLLLAGHWLGRPAHDRLFRVLAGTLIALLFVIMASAVQRMLLYQQEYGLTELRLYTTAFMAWLAVLFSWFCLTVLRGRRERFAFGALISGLVVIAALNVLNPDAFIARTNVGRAEGGVGREEGGRSLDADYAATLSADAVPTLTEALERMGEDERSVVAAALLRRWAPTDRTDWRTWNWSRWQARRIVERHEVVLRSHVK